MSEIAWFRHLSTVPAIFDHNDWHMTSEIFTFPLRECSSLEWYNFPKDHRCPHDAWVESITISEPSSGERHQVRGLEIRVRLLGAYHDGNIEFTYKRVLRYLMGAVPQHRAGHGDWLEDDVDVKGRFDRAQGETHKWEF
jgi:hypothetical protein